ncbi:Elongator subunit [Mucor velutinosus]|uniref:Elongator subunit n=1 Tax=Mucor velutinosus TaxID=708070 RepID=A0AAN7DHS3_9FUNG|nr:Elongator subunit [Mucor velutinosus]
MAVSKQVIHVIGLNVTVYGLDEYNQLPKGTRVSIMFALHGRLQNQSKMEPIAQAICQLNEKRDKNDAHILVVTFDCPNHGSRLVHKLANFAWVEGKHKNPNHALDMWSMVNSTARTVTELIDVLEHYIFGPQSGSLVQVWGCMGFSMGGHATFMAAANDSRITVAIPIVGIADYLALMESRLKESDLSPEIYLPKPFYDMVSTSTKDLDQKLSSKHILIMNGGKDVLVKAEFNGPLVRSLQQIHSGREGYDWKYYLVPNVGHAWCPEMVESSVEWCYRWMMKNSVVPASKL